MGGPAQRRGDAWIAGRLYSRVQKLDARGRFPQYAGAGQGIGQGHGRGGFMEPCGVALGPDGSLYVTDTATFRVQQLDAKGTFRRERGGRGTRPGEFTGPYGVAVDPDGMVLGIDSLSRVENRGGRV